MPSLINWRIARQPLNWIIVLLMVIIAGIALHVVVQGLQNGAPASAQ
jgi:hypothetical protein